MPRMDHMAVAMEWVLTVVTMLKEILVAILG